MTASVSFAVFRYIGTKRTDITNLVTSINWGGNVAEVGRSCEISLKNTRDGESKIISDLKCGQEIRCSKRGKEFFRGYIFKMDIASSGDMSILAWDSNIYLAKNSDTKKFVKKKASQILQEICKQYGIAYGKIDDTGYVIPKLILRDKSLADMITIALTETRKKTGKVFILHNEHGKITLRERKTQMVQLIVSDGTNLLNASYSESIEEMKNSVRLTGSSGEDAKGVSVSDPKSIENHGTLRIKQHESEKTDAQLKPIAVALLKELNVVAKESNVEAIGDTSIKAGRSIKVYERMTGIQGGFYVTADSHTFEANGTHKMQLTLSRTLDVAELDYEPPEEAANSSSSSSASTTNFSTSASTYLHRKTTTKMNITADQINKAINLKVAGRTSVLKNAGKYFVQAANESGLNALYLLSHAAEETGWGTSRIARTKHNFYGIGAFDSSAYSSAHKYGGVQAGIVEGAKWISRNYANGKYKQDTLYKMRFNNGVHEYATNKSWANNIANVMASVARIMNDGTSSSKSSGTSSTKRNAVVSMARKYVGKLTYKFSSKSITNGTGDCSGFTTFVYKNAVGLNIGHGTSTQITKGVKISNDEAQPGDIIFFKGTYRAGVSHVGIVTSKGKCISLASSGCKEHSYVSGYWGSHFMQIRRVL